jgi:hypothetical protein
MVLSTTMALPVTARRTVRLTSVHTTFCNFLLMPVNLSLSPKQPFQSLISPLLLWYLPFPCLVLFIHSSTFTLVPHSDSSHFSSFFYFFQSYPPFISSLLCLTLVSPIPFPLFTSSPSIFYSGTPSTCPPSNFFIFPQLVWHFLPVPLFTSPPHHGTKFML